MPLYEYECFLCGHRFERIQRVSDETVSDCPECGGSVRRLLSAPALQFKGSGWYVTDYGNGRSRGTTETGNGPGTTGDDCDAKPARSGETSSNAGSGSDPGVATSGD